MSLAGGVMRSPSVQRGNVLEVALAEVGKLEVKNAQT